MSYESVEALTEALLNQAQRDRQRLIHEAEMTAQRIIAQAEGDALAQRAHITEHAKGIAADLEREAKGSARLEAQAIKVRKREALLEEVFSRAAEQLAEFDRRADYDQIVVSLVLDAARWFVSVRPDPADRQPSRDAGLSESEAKSLVILADETARQVLDEETLRRLGEEVGVRMTLARDARLYDALPEETGQQRPLGVIVQSADGHLRYDNTLYARLTRMRGALRASAFRVLMGEPQ
jgi:vacuolar-type H+-ATPase subunit E/Vma4